MNQSEANTMRPEDTHIGEINPYYFRMINREKKRINIILPSINPEHVFGGISTAIKFFEQFARVSGYDKRMILVDAVPSEEAVQAYQEEYTFLDPDQDSNAPAQIVPYSTRMASGIPVSNEEYVIFTGWWTAHCAHEAYALWEKETGLKAKPFIYLIQDFEPGFYAWSTRYLLADATYRSSYPQIAVFNTSLLQAYFRNNGYSFYKNYAFEPVLNARLKERLYDLEGSLTKKKQLLVYGRPGTDRNAFSLIVTALKKWVTRQQDVKKWSVLSAGEQHLPVELGDGVYLKSVGKLSLDEYADMLAESYVGISLMASPHPSYPPLEMSVFGMKVLTNTFANKDLSSFNDNILSLESITPENIARQLERLCNGYKPSIPHCITNQEYCDNEDVFGFVGEIQKILEGDEKQ